MHRNARDSAEDFKNIVWPYVSEWFQNSTDIVDVESVTEADVADVLDQQAGVDYWSIGELMYGIASRVQWVDAADGDEPYNTFSVRCETKYGVNDTEYEKRLKSINRDATYPTYTLQAYLTERDGAIMSVASIKTKDLIHYIEDGDQGKDYYRKDRGYKNDFYFVKWGQLSSPSIALHYDKPYESDETLQTEADKPQQGLSDFLDGGGDE
jgi:hypothetical protein